MHPLSPGERFRVRVTAWRFATAALTPPLSQRERA